MEKMEIGEYSENFSKRDPRRVMMIFGISLVAASLYILVLFGQSKAMPILFRCPREIELAENYDPLSFDEVYEQETKKITKNLTEFLETFRTDTFDDWGHTYDEVKTGMHAWKSKMFPPEINEGDSIYESACGIGLNLFMTLEILKEIKNIDTLYVYGNEYLQVSADKANAVFDNVAPNNAKKGVICAGDSTNLYFVPSNAFDLVYTGYISPLLDPLHFNLESDENYKKLATLCESNDRQSQAQSDMGQELQDNFYGKWVAEMVRIAKPGKAVIIEQVSVPYCDEYLDWGGVNQTFWRTGITKYGWDIDPTSLVIEDDTIFTQRYHVFMRKNKK